MTATAENGRLRVSVEDSGPGVAREIEETLFDRFTRAGGADRVAGAGLGLAIAQAYARAHRGDLRYERATRQVLASSSICPPYRFPAWPEPISLPVAFRHRNACRSTSSPSARGRCSCGTDTRSLLRPVPGLRAAARMARRAPRRRPSRIFLTNGSLQGFVFLARRLAPGKRVLVEDPTYDRPLKILRELGAEIVPLALRRRRAGSRRTRGGAGCR